MKHLAGGEHEREVERNARQSRWAPKQRSTASLSFPWEDAR